MNPMDGDGFPNNGDHVDDFETDADVMAKLRKQYEDLVQAIERKRPILEARGDDVDAMLEVTRTEWEDFQKTQADVDEKEEAYLQSVADAADAREKMLDLIRRGLAQWHAAVNATPEGSIVRVEVWEGLMAWKRQMREAVTASLNRTSQPQMKDTLQEVLRLLK